MVNRDCAPHGSYEIVVHEVTEADAGSYAALASNTVGQEECTSAVTVKGKNIFFLVLFTHVDLLSSSCVMSCSCVVLEGLLNPYGRYIT